MSLLIRNGIIITAGAKYEGDVFCEGEQITRIGRGLEVPAGATVIDAAGKLVMPGFVDPHVHVYLPLKTVCSKDTYETASRAALVGGTTCFIDFCSPNRNELPLHALDVWHEKSEGKSACDYSFHMAVTRNDRETEQQLREVVRRGVTSFKVYLAYKDSVNLPDRELVPTLRLAAELGVMTMGHCEDAEAIDRLQKQLIAEGKTGPEWHYHSRPPSMEAAGTKHFASLARETGARAYVVHLSCEESLQAALVERDLGADLRIETLTSYLLLDKSYAERANFEGAKYIVSPPLREKRNQAILWEALKSGVIHTVGTDHAPFDFATQKQLGRDDFTKIPNGMPTLEDRVNLLFTYGVLEGRIDLQRMVDVASTQPAKLFGLYPKKGAIQVGSDADLVVYDPAFEQKISARTQSMNVDYNPFEGWTIKGRPDVVTVRGEVAVQGGRFVGRIGRGRFIARRAGP